MILTGKPLDPSDGTSCEFELDDHRVVTNYLPISVFADLVEAELAARGVVRTAVQQTIQNMFKPGNAGKVANWFAETHIRIAGGKKQTGYILLPASAVKEYADYLAGGAK